MTNEQAEPSSKGSFTVLFLVSLLILAGVGTLLFLRSREKVLPLSRSVTIPIPTEYVPPSIAPVENLQTGAELVPLPASESAVINETARLRLLLPVSSDKFSLRYDIENDIFEVTLSKGSTKSDLAQWLVSQELGDIPPEKFKF